LLGDVNSRIFDMYGDDTTLGAQRPLLGEMARAGPVTGRKLPD